MKRFLASLGFSVAGLVIGILLVAFIHARIVSPRSDFASTVGYTAGAVATSLANLPAAIAAHLRFSPFRGIAALGTIVAWTVCAILSPRMPKALAVVGAILLPVVWVACITA